MARRDNDASNPLIDAYGKITISLGGFCPLQCSHCYTTVPDFSSDPKRTVKAALKILESVSENLKIVCLSGDTDPFLRPYEAIDFLEAAADSYPTADLMYTTRLTPREHHQQQLVNIGNKLAIRGQLCVPAVSLVTASYPNNIENASLVPSSAERLAFLSILASSQQPTMLALRPTFPFEVVPPTEVHRLLAMLDSRVRVILGETLLLDQQGVIANRLGLAATLGNDASGSLTFLNQPTTWFKRRHPQETRYMTRLCAANRRQFFTRSISALHYFHSHWSLQTGRLRYDPAVSIDMSAELLDP
jgi:DNA repair photolyase